MKLLNVLSLSQNHVIQGRRPFAMQAELGVVRLQQRNTSVRQQTLILQMLHRKMETSTSADIQTFYYPPQIATYLRELFTG